MPKNEGFQPIEYTPGEQPRPIVSELPQDPAPKPVKAHAAPPKPQPAAEKKEN